VKKASQNGFVFVIGPYMQKALRFSRSLVHEEGLPITDPLRRMRWAFERLDTAIIAVLVATDIPESDQEESALNSVQQNILRDKSPADIEFYMVNLTGYRGWRGVIETRDILRGTLASICGKNTKALTYIEANSFDSAVLEALNQLNRLVNGVANFARG